MVYTGVAEAADMLNFEVDSTESVWYTCASSGPVRSLF